MRKIQYILLCVWMLVGASLMSAQTPANIMYVRADGKYTNDGKSWATAKNNIQDAINYMVANKMTGEVWVGAGTYRPTESTESTVGSTQYMAFKIPAGITVRGGFPADGKDEHDQYITRADQRPMSNALVNSIGGFYANRTILTGATGQEASFVWDEATQQYNTTFYGNSYHVVWFAMNGFYPDGHAVALNTTKGEAVIEGCEITNGYAKTTETAGHPHEGYGGGVYMVKGSRVENCYIHDCEANRNGGGIYMDGGGWVEHSFVGQCQALGQGNMYGFGGGICLEDGHYGSVAEGMYPTVVNRTGMVGCVGRNGGGGAIYCNNPLYKNRLVMASVLIANNVALNEAGGLYCYQGGGVTQATIVRNKCAVSSGIATNGIMNGRSGGLYVRDFANVANTVVWGNAVAANRDVQFASSRSDSHDEAKKPLVRFSMLSRSDYADWSGVVKMNVSPLSDKNRSSDPDPSTTGGGFPAFVSPSKQAGYEPGIMLRSLRDLTNDEKNALGIEDDGRAYSWKVDYSSILTNHGLRSVDIDIEGLTPSTERTYDIVGQLFPTYPTLGGYSANPPTMTYWNDNNTWHVFIDQNYTQLADENEIGSSWDHPIRDLNDALHVTDSLVREADSKPTKVVFHLKEGNVNNRGYYTQGRVRNSPLVFPNLGVPLEILGSYHSGSTGRDTTQRNPIMHPTTINGTVMNNYDYNASHMLHFEGVSNITIDGFHLRYANATSAVAGNTNFDGAAITLRNSTGIRFRNVLVAHCTAERGAAVFAEGGTTATFENCIFHNNSTSLQFGIAGNAPSIIYAKDDAELTFDHCDVLRNVGYASWMDGSATNEWTNSIFYGNFNQTVEDTNYDGAYNDAKQFNRALPAFGGETARASGSYCMFDQKSNGFFNVAGKFPTWDNNIYTLSYVFDGGANSQYPRFINPTKNAGVSVSGDVTYYGRATSFEPHNTNPMVNAASTKGVPHPAGGTSDCWGKDFTCQVNRDFGGLPDVGAVENHVAVHAIEGENAYEDGQGYYGRTLYVRQYATLTEGGDGSSWQNAINGNAYYHEKSGTFLGDQRQKVITWTKDTIIYTLKYIDVAAPFSLDTVTSTVAQPKLHYIYNVHEGKYLKVTSSGAFSFVANRDDANLFVVLSNLAIYDYYNNKYITYSGNKASNYKFTESNTAYQWRIDNKTGRIYFTAGGKSYYWRSNGSSPSLGNTDSQNVWKLVRLDQSNPHHEQKTVTETVTGINGLQYAVNSLSYQYSLDNISREVWVAAGTYSKDNETVKTGHFNVDYSERNGDESCFMIRDGVDVYGAFPKVGNPGMEQRQALVSQYIPVVTGYDPAEYETILKPATTTVQAGVTLRVLGQPVSSNPRIDGYVPYGGALWDGFTLKAGVLDAALIDMPNRNGGAGASAYENVMLRNMVVYSNTTLFKSAGSEQNFRGGGLYVDGGTIVGAYIINNTLTGWGTSAKAQNGAAYGGGVYMYKGTIYNSVIANNQIFAKYADGAGAFIESANFFNNTIVNNKADYSNRGAGGVAVYNSSGESTLNIYNSIIANNDGFKAKPASGSNPVGIGTKDVAVQGGGFVHLHNCITEATNDESVDWKSSIYGSIVYDHASCQAITGEPLKAVFVKLGNYDAEFKTLNLRLAANSSAINRGENAPVIGGVTYELSEYVDMDYTDRIKDCTIDLGAYEYDAAWEITPTVVDNVASYYVTPSGRGTASAADPANAACADKLQKVLDAAGRYKCQNPGKQVIVRVATDGRNFEYYANRTTDLSNQDVRLYSIMVPKGVELWGGYTDAYTDASNHGFLDSGRDVTAHATYFDAHYYNKAQVSTVQTYHVFTFTDHVFDADGLPYLVGDSIGLPSTYSPSVTYAESDYRHIGGVDRAVLDGVFITNGNANSAAQADEVNRRYSVHQFGGAAVVEPYAHVRNCILENNAALYGGALALKDQAMVSGCLFRYNSANQGGAVYVPEDGTTLYNANIDYVIHTQAPSGQPMGLLMPKVYFSTIVKNNAQVGGGLWFTSGDPNLRVNSTVLWHNTGDDQPNVAGNYNPEIMGDVTSTIDFYPFAYSAVENQSMAGANNFMLNQDNKLGARFATAETDNTTPVENRVIAEDDNHISYYGLTNYSSLIRTGMPVSEFNKLLPLGVSQFDFRGLDRTCVVAGQTRSYIEVGARALLRPFKAQHLMLRLYVAQPEDMNADVAVKMASMTGENVQGGYTDEQKTEIAEYYSQQGSSFAYPFQSLQDALDYIYLMRSTNEYNSSTYVDYFQANNMPFEIIIGRGTYAPSRDLSGSYGESLANTFAIPEGVSLYGGFRLADPHTNEWYGRHVTPKTTLPAYIGTYPDHVYDLSNCVDVINESSVTFHVSDVDYTLLQESADDMMASRTRTDVNKNNVIEPWEFEQQTILSGNATNATDKGVYHIVTIVPDQAVVGVLPHPQYVLDPEMKVAPEGYNPNELGQYIHFNGITFQGGRAHSYTSALDEMSKYNYYHGGAVLADGNRYNDDYNRYYASVEAYNSANSTTLSKEDWLALQHGTEYKDLGHTNAVGYRDAPISFASCRFYDNEAGYGGAISTNMEIELYQSSFEHNRASYYSDVVPSAGGNINVTYAGQGGAVFSTFHVTGFNTIFANNEATDLTHTDMTSAPYYSYRNHNSGGSMELPGTGGAIYSGLHGFIHLFNSNVVRNMANSYPAIFTMNPNFYTPAWASGAAVESQRYNQITNTLLWGNELLPAAKRNPANAGKLFAAQLVVNYGAATRTSVIPYVPADNNPANQAALDDAEHDDDLTQKRYTEMLHFCAYEPGRGKTHKNENDFRTAELAAGRHTIYQYSHISDGKGGYLPYQNSNVVVVSDNDALDGPAFMRPTTEAGVAGYLESADWSPSRLNNLTDMGNTHLEQDETGTEFEKNAQGQFDGTGSYWLARYMSQYPNYMHNLPLGDEPYMTLKQASTNNQMYRISLDPNPTHELTYIDIGVYEYIHEKLTPSSEDNVDILWVSNYEKPENGVPDGSSWAQPTSDLQRAIETLLFDRNGHRKEIRLCDGTYSPIYTFAMTNGSLQTFMVDANLNGATGASGVVSLTIKGGYSREFQNLYSTTLYPAVLRQQARADQSSTKWDHLIYVKSASQANVTNKIFPIHIQGVSLVNDQALSAAQGSALYYAASSLTSPTTSDATVTTSEPGASHTSTAVANPAKLILSNSIVMASTGASTVKIDPKGGSTLLYNNVFHSNAGKPLVASAATTVNNTFALNGGMVELGAGSKIMNSVLWRNNPEGGSGYGYQLSLSGLSHDSGNTGDFAHSDATAAIFSNNAYTGGDVVDIEYDPGKGSAIPAHNYNVGLVNLNTDVTYGPNFIDPENTDVTLRRYNINPSMRLLNKGNNTFYDGVALKDNSIIYDLAWEPTKMKDAASNHRLEAVTIDLGAYEYQYSLNRVLYVNPNLGSGGTGLDWEHALGAGNIQNAIDLAGVYASNENKPAYVFVKAASASNPTMHTEEVLTLRNGVQIYGSIREDYMVECPYVQDGQGVRDYEIETDKTLLDAYVSDMLHYGRFGILSPVEGHTRILGINTNGTAFSTRPVGGGAYLASVIDGFDVVPGSRGAAISAPALHINPFKADETPATGNVKVVLRNIAVHGFTAQGCNVAEVNNALLYSTLMHHNTTTGGKAVLDLGQYGHLVNGTIEGTTTKASGSQVLNSLTNFDATPATYQTLTGYCYRMEDDNLNYQLTEQSPNIDGGNDELTALPDDLRGFVNYGRDLYTAEDAAEVNRLVGLSYLEGAIGGQKLKAVEGQIMNADRDLLGNYRYQPDLTLGKNGNYIDRGAFETWRVDKDHLVVYPNYPYPGTSEYIMEGKSLVIDAPEDGGDATTAAHIPGFVLIQSGASLYGNGRELLISYGAVERKEKIGSEVIFSTPWHQSMIPVGLSDDRLNRTSGLFVVTYDNETGVMQMLHNNPTVYTYDGSKRMDWQHRMKPSKSDCWVAVDPAVTPYLEANVGVYTLIEGATLDPGTEITIRCTAHGSSIHDYVYTEEVNDGRQQHVSKSIALHHYDDHQSTGGAADFTDEKNAGWNFIGYPYLTSQYQPYNKVSINHAQKDAMSVIVNDGSDAFLDNTAPYAMDHAKTMWLWYDGKVGPDDQPVDGTGGFYSVNSWETGAAAWHVKTDAEAVLRLGDGIFVQTHTLQENEELVFYRPVYTGASSSAPGRYYVGDEPEIEIVSPSAVGDAIRWEKVVHDDRVLLVQRDEDGVIRSAYDISGRRVQM